MITEVDVRKPLRYIEQCPECGADHFYCDVCQSAVCGHVLRLLVAMLA